jgi:integrase/recombinase XerD
MKCVINGDVVLSRAPDGPLASYIGPFAESQRTQGYARGSIRRQVLLGVCFSHWLKQQCIGLREIRSEHPSRYLRWRARRVRRAPGDVAALRHLLEYVRHQGVMHDERRSVRRLTPVEHCVLSYAQYLRDVRALAGATIVNYLPFIRGFLEARFGDATPLARIGPGLLARSGPPTNGLRSA